MSERRDEINSLVEMVKLDYQQTLGVIDGLVRVSTGVRSLAITVWVGLLAASFETQNWALAAIATGAILIFALLDAYHGWLYSQARKRAYDIEDLLGDHCKQLGRRDDENAEIKLLSGLRKHRFGQLRSFKKFENLGFYGEARPAFFYKRVYPLLGLAALGVAIGVGLANCDDHPVENTTCLCHEGQKPESGQLNGSKSEFKNGGAERAPVKPPPKADAHN